MLRSSPFPFASLVAFSLAVAVGCGARLEPADPRGDAAVDGGPGDTGSFVATRPPPAEDAVAPVTPPPTSDDAGVALGPLTYVVALDVCASAPGVDKIIFDVSEPLAPLPSPSPVHATPGGTTCSDGFDSSVGSTTYAWGVKCGAIDVTRPITVTVTAPVRTAKGVELAPGTMTFRPTGAGKLCGTRYRP